MPAYTTLIQPQDLAALISKEPGRVVICDCRFDLANHTAGPAAYQAGHIPGAAYMHLESVLSGPKTGMNGRHPLPSREALAAKMAELGADNDGQIVAYDAADGMFAARLWWLMRWLGHEAVAVLDGGLAAWKAAGLEVETAAPVAAVAGAFTIRTPLVKTIDYAALLETKDASLLFDARAPDRFRGENETLDPIGGHIPGARNRFFKNNVEADGRFKSGAMLREDFQKVLGGHAADEAVAYCGSGVTACHNLLAMEIAGLGGTTLYPGSWSEWSAQPAAPIATGDA